MRLNHRAVFDTIAAQGGIDTLAQILEVGKSKACDDLFRIGNHYYWTDKNYQKADYYYSRAIQETNYYSGTESLFCMAYALYEKRYGGKGEESDRRMMAKCQENLGNYQQAKQIYEDMFLKHDASQASLYLYELYQKMPNTAENIHNAVGCGIVAIRLTDKTDANWMDPIYEYVRKHGTENDLNDVLHLCPRFQAIEDRRRAEEARIAQQEAENQAMLARQLQEQERRAEEARIAHKKQQDDLDLMLLMF